MLVFKPFEKNLFHQTRAWSAIVDDGRYVIIKAPATDGYQAQFHPNGSKPVSLKEGAWVTSLKREQSVCEQDQGERQRQRILRKFRTRPRPQ